MRMINYAPLNELVPWCSGLTCGPVKAEIAGSNPVGTACIDNLMKFHQVVLIIGFVKGKNKLTSKLSLQDVIYTGRSRLLG